MGMKEDGPKRPNKKLLYYYGIILLITILLNAFWQYTNQGQVPGITGNTDLNIEMVPR